MALARATSAAVKLGGADGAGPQLDLQPLDDLPLQIDLFLQQVHSLPGGDESHQGVADAAAHFPGGSGDVEPGRVREVLRLLDPPASFAAVSMGTSKLSVGIRD